MDPQRVLTTHTGSPPRPDDLVRLLYGRERGVERDDDAAFEQRVREAVQEVVDRQAQAGLDILNDGEMSKVAYSTYVTGELFLTSASLSVVWYFLSLLPEPRGVHCGDRRRYAPRVPRHPRGRRPAPA